MMSEKLKFNSFSIGVRLVFIIVAMLSGVTGAAAETINVSVNQAKIKRGEFVEVTVKTRSRENVRA
ncbi:MAG: hypothetical protein M3R14_15030, partial [Acidobacteriota bacterium]|nr:hypothetical protein [Acidobacteriota bacterium]